MHSVFDQLVVTLAGSSRTLRKPGAGGVLRLLETIGGSELGRVEPESDSMQDGSPGAAVVQTRRVNGLRSIKRSACNQLRLVLRTKRG